MLDHGAHLRQLLDCSFNSRRASGNALTMLRDRQFRT